MDLHEPRLGTILVVEDDISDFVADLREHLEPYCNPPDEMLYSVKPERGEILEDSLRLAWDNASRIDSVILDLAITEEHIKLFSEVTADHIPEDLIRDYGHRGGYKIIPKLKNIVPNVPIYILSAFLTNEIKLLSIKLGAHWCIPKGAGLSWDLLRRILAAGIAKCVGILNINGPEFDTRAISQSLNQEQHGFRFEVLDDMVIEGLEDKKTAIGPFPKI